MRVLVIYASADGSTAEIAKRIADRLSERDGDQAVARPVNSVHELDGIDAVVLGSAIHGREWLDEAATFVARNHRALQQRPLWIFSVGMPDALPRVFRKMARTEETGVIAKLGDLRPRGHRLFSGVVKPSQFPFAGRVFLHLVGGRYGDFRDWPAIDRWATEVSDHLHELPQGGSSEASPTPLMPPD